MAPPRGLNALHLHQGHPDFCQVLEHKWFLSERAKRDVGLEVAVKGYVALRREQPALALLRSASAPLPAAEARAEASPSAAPEALTASSGRG